MRNGSVVLLLSAAKAVRCPGGRALARSIAQRTHKAAKDAA